MRFEPYTYQSAAINHIIEHKKAGVFLEPGLGKTVITLTAIQRLKVRKALVIAPLRVARYVWQGELNKWDHLSGLTMSIVVGIAKQRIKALSVDADIYVINREMIIWLIDHLGELPYDMIVIDELSSFKSPSSQRFKALKRWIDVDRVVGLTGTPATNSYIDLWSQLYLLDVGERLGKTCTGYKMQYFYPLLSNGHIVYKWGIKTGARQTIDSKISDICISMEATDYLDMPECIYNIIPIYLDTKEMSIYKELKKQMVIEIDNNSVIASNPAVLCTKLVQCANGAVYDDEHNVQVIHDKKLEALSELIECNSDKSVLVFYTYIHDRDRILTHIKGSEMLNIERWTQGRQSVALAHPASFGHGLNLQTGGHIIVWYGLTWSLELYIQANARLWRQGQAESVIIHHLICQNTIDTTIYTALQAKSDMQKMLLEAIKYGEK